MTLVCFTGGMAIISDEIAGSRVRVGTLGRTPSDIQSMIGFLRDNPDDWYVYSIHINMAAAHTRASGLRGPRMPASMVAHKRHLEFKGHRHTVHGPVVLVRWVA